MPKRIKRNKRTVKSPKAPLKPPDIISEGKRHFTKTVHKGSFFKQCPGTIPGYLCCNYYVLNLQTGCNINCHYCILQSYINNNRITIYSNLENALQEVKTFLKKHPDNFYRIGTGELTDSLSLDHKTKTSLKLIPFFAKQPNALLELKTKSDNIYNILLCKPKNNIVISWSLNTPIIIKDLEEGAPQLRKRLIAAKKCLRKGYSIGFHLDPIILYPDWEKDYKNLVEQIFEYIPPGEIVWISIAGFRAPQSLKNIIQERFPKTKLFTQEMIFCRDGKYRYIRPLRVNMYKKIISWIKDFDSNLPVYFCMESPAVWNDVFGKLPHEIENLNGIFGRHTKPIRLN